MKFTSVLKAAMILALLPFLSYSQSRFKQLDISNMVDLSTGDLNYSIPILTIPGDGRDFPLNLQYRSPIKLESESLWTGLGWDLGPGKIERLISEIPDDYNGDTIRTQLNDPGDQHTVSVPSYLEQVFNSVDAYGKSASDNFKKGVLSKNTNTIVRGVADLSKALSLTEALLMNPSDMFFMNLASPRMNYNVSSWDWNIDEHHNKKKIWFVTTGWDESITYRWWLDALKEEKCYGILYQSNIPTLAATSGSSNYFNPAFSDPADNQNPSLYNRVSTETDGKRSFDPVNYSSDYYQGSADAEMYKNNKPIYWAGDQYFVSSLDLNGELQPIRFDNSSVATSLNSNIFYDNRIALYKYRISASQQGKVQFSFLQNLSNQYSYHKDVLNGDFKINYTIKPIRDGVNYLHLESQPGLNSIKPTDEFFNGKNEMYKGTAVKWFSTQEILNNAARDNGFMNYPGLVRSAENPSLIGGFMITSVDGYTYHFALPVFTHSYQNTSSNTTTFKNDLATKYARQWLITAITGPSFSDGGDVVGEIDDNDTGWYVKFEYGKYMDDFNERFPKATSPSDNFTISRLISDLYFLNSIRTNTHTAFFLKGTRNDSYSQPEFFSLALSNNKNSLALNEIIVLKNADADYLKSLFGSSYLSGLSGYNGNQANVLKVEDIYNNATVKDFVGKNQINRVKFRYDHSLCQGMPTSKSGKLTLRGLDILDRNGSNPLGSYNFDYSFNPAYNNESSDAWGLYKNNTVTGEDMHKVDNESEGTAWALTSVTEVTGGKILIDYGRDKYSSVSGEPLETGITEKWGGDLRVNTIKLVVEDGKISSQFKYDYTLPSGITSGVVTNEPPQVKGLHRKVDDIYGYPSSVVTYGTVKRSHFSNDDSKGSDEIVRFNYSTADINSTVTVKELLNKKTVLTADFTEGSKLTGYDIHEQAYETIYKHRKIGLLNSTEKLDNDSNLIERSEYIYEESDMGSFTQGLNLLDNTYRVYSKSPGDENAKDWRMSYRYINSISRYVPFRLTQINNSNFKTHITSTNRFYEFDTYTGNPTKVGTNDGYGNSYLTETTPAYKVYAGMGLGVIGGKNMLTQDAASYSYKIDPTNINIKKGLASASIQTWSNQVPVVQPNLSLSLPSDQTSIWRTKSSYSFASDITAPLSGDGLYSLSTNSVPTFTSWYGATEPASIWQKKNEATLYDVNSHALEVTDINGIHTSTKMSLDNTRMLVTCRNCSYGELAYSGAEEQPLNSRYGLPVFGGDVRCNGTWTSEQAHTGKYSVKAGPGSGAFSYILSQKESSYIVSFWSSQPSANVKYQQGQLAIVSAQLRNVGKAGNWYLFEATIPSLGGSDPVVIWNAATSTTTYFDDFRIHPLDAIVTSYVYNGLGELSHILDNNNLYTEYRYDGVGRLKETYKETFQVQYGMGGIAKTGEIDYNYGQNNIFTLTLTATSTGMGSVQPTGATRVPLNGEQNFTLTSPCSTIPISSLEIDGKTVQLNSSQTLLDGTQVLLSNSLVTFKNLKGPHRMSINFLTDDYDGIYNNPTISCYNPYEATGSGDDCFDGSYLITYFDDCMENMTQTIVPSWNSIPAELREGKTQDQYNCCINNAPESPCLCRPH